MKKIFLTVFVGFILYEFFNVLSGWLLTVLYVPDIQKAWENTLFLSNEVVMSSPTYAYSLINLAAAIILMFLFYKKVLKKTS